MSTEIKINTDMKQIKAVFYSHGHHKLFYGLYNKKQSLVLLIGLLIFPFYIFYTIKYDIRWLLVFGIFIYGIIIKEFWRTTKSVYKWRKSVSKFLKTARKVKELTIIYDDLYFIHIQDGNELKLEWSEIEKAQINDLCIWLFAKGIILLPRKSMTETEFNLLLDVVQEKVKNIEKG